MGNLPVPRFLDEEDISEVRGVLNTDIGVVGIGEPSEDAAPLAQLLVTSDGILICIIRNIPSSDIVALRPAEIRGGKKFSDRELRDTRESARGNRIAGERGSGRRVNDRRSKPARQLVWGRDSEKVLKS